MKVYDVFKELDSNTVNAPKDWRDAFIEYFPTIKNKCLKDNYGSADCLYVHTNINDCTDLTPLIAYVSQFECGGFWFSKDCGLHFLTDGVGSDKDATYDDALVFCANWKQLKG